MSATVHGEAMHTGPRRHQWVAIGEPEVNGRGDRFQRYECAACHLRGKRFEGSPAVLPSRDKHVCVGEREKTW